MILKNIFKKAAFFAPNIAVAVYAIAEIAKENLWLLPAAMFLYANSIMYHSFLSPNAIKVRGAKLTDPEPEIKNIFDDLCKKAGVSDLPLYIADGFLVKNNASAISSSISKSVWLGENLKKEVSKEEIKFILAHEIEHIRLSHNNKKIDAITAKNLSDTIFGAAIAYYAIRTVAGALGQDIPHLPLVDLTITGNWVLDASAYNKVSKKHEYEADAGALKITGDIDAARSLFEFIGNKGAFKNASFISSHPSPKQRIEALEDIVVTTAISSNSLSRGIV